MPPPTSASSAAGAEGRATEMPVLRAFVGRAGELLALGRALDEGARLLTLTGAAGMGKTRLALEWARSAERDGARVFFCDLSEARTLDDACAVLGRVLAVPLADGTADEVVAQLGRALAQAGRCVVILDNFEQLVALAARMLPPLLGLSPGAQLLVTSRERLRLEGETTMELEPLGLPPSDERSSSAIAASEAVALFVARTRAVRSGFTLTEAEAPSVAEIVRRVDGIPLAIELCAARMGVLAPEQILSRLARRFDLLVTGVRGAPARQATLRGAIDSSWDLLAPWEKAALAQCSVFHGGLSLEAAEAVLDLSGAGAEPPPPVLDVLQSLHDKSLLRAFDAPGPRSPVRGTERRYGLLESLRAYAEERLSELGGAPAAARRHAAFYLSFPPATPVARLALELDNLTAVCMRALAHRPMTTEAVDTALRGLLLLEPVLLMCSRGRLDPFVAMLDVALAAAEEAQVVTTVRARALYVRALADLLRGRPSACFFGFQRAREGARAAGSRRDEGLALTKLGFLLEHADHPDEARACFDEARAIALALNDPALEADWMLMLGGGLIWRGRAADAVWYEQQASEGFKRAGDARGETMALGQLALARFNVGLLEEAEGAARAALDLLRATEDRRTEGYVLGVLGRVQHAGGRFAEARATYAAALAVHAAVGDRWSLGVHHGLAGHVAFDEQRLEEARRAYGEAVALLQGAGDWHYAAIFLGALGAVELSLGEGQGGASRFAAADAVLAKVPALTPRIILELYRGHEQAVLAREAAAAGDTAAAARHLGAATAIIARAEAPAPDGAPAPARSSGDVRFARRMLERELARSTGAVATAPPERRDAAASLLVVGPEARWFRLRDREPALMSKARAARLILALLVQRRLEAPGRALSLDELFQAGWPGEKIAGKAASNRVYVTLTKLRQLGLGRLLQSRDDGFLIDPTAVVVESLDTEQPGRGASG